jgi:3',5'-nucleoside bisphosphate phosphatase
VKRFIADLHVHTVLSPCAQIEMIPPLIVREALNKNINLIAITDHNSTANIVAVQKAAHKTGLAVLPGIEIQTREDIHSLCLFDTVEQTDEFQKIITASLPAIKNRPDFFGEQFVVDETGDFIRHETQLLITSIKLTLTEAWQQVANLGGILIPAHIDRKAFGLLPTLGFVPTDIPIEALEISRFINPNEAIRKFPELKGYPLLQNGDVHGLEEFLGAIEISMESPTIAEIRQAINGINARSLTLKTLEYDI